ncbi:MAG TPA: hypothetical protein DCG69_03175 [Bacteroidales bacterium]|nr:hypothetical protein [Bacteroidales bacterium]
MLYTVKKNSSVLIKILLPFFLFSCLIMTSCKPQSELIEVTSEDPMVRKFYTLHHESLYWFSSGKNIRKAKEWLKVLEMANSFGLDAHKLQIDQIRLALSNRIGIESSLKAQTDQQITGLILNFIKELQEGVIHFDYDEVRVLRDSVYVYQLIDSKKHSSVFEFISQIESKDQDYLVLKKFLNDSLTTADTLKYKTVVRAMNYRRYLTINHQSEYVLVNIPTAEAEYYNNNLLVLKMRTVPGKKKNQTPTIASYITSIVTFPSWNVPHTIAVKEILPKVQIDKTYLELHNFEVVDAKGNAMDDEDLIWENYTERNFPYFFRQSTGASNSLGLIKFDLENPFSIYLHATNWQGAFEKEYRFLSHGCIRLEKPFELADALLRSMIDIQELKDGKKNTESTIIDLPTKVQVFLIYVPVTVVEENVVFLPDVYDLIK